MGRVTKGGQQRLGRGGSRDRPWNSHRSRRVLGVRSKGARSLQEEGEGGILQTGLLEELQRCLPSAGDQPCLFTLFSILLIHVSPFPCYFADNLCRNPFYFTFSLL